MNFFVDYVISAVPTAGQIIQVLLRTETPFTDVSTTFSVAMLLPSGSSVAMSNMQALPYNGMEYQYSSNLTGADATLVRVR